MSDTTPHQQTDPVAIDAIVDRLDEMYGHKRWAPGGDPVSELVATILSQNTSDANSSRAFQALRTRFPTWEAVVSAPVASVADAISSGGLANIKAPRIQSVLAAVLASEPDGSLDHLRTLSVSDARQHLCMLPGVGAKTASCVLLFSLGMPAMPVDTHVHRVATRLGLVPAGTSSEAAHDLLESALGDGVDRAYSFHVNMITHGRTVCRARAPRCSTCGLRPLCAFGRAGDGAS